MDKKLFDGFTADMAHLKITVEGEPPLIRIQIQEPNGSAECLLTPEMFLGITELVNRTLLGS